MDVNDNACCLKTTLSLRFSRAGSLLQGDVWTDNRACEKLTHRFTIDAPDQE
ncbi:UNVERIFIED_ORG: hypothetical protein J2Y76_000402 [Pseudomonas reinekei]|nr:hypothetical protein [Pseudomonas reinekei]